MSAEFIIFCLFCLICIICIVDGITHEMRFKREMKEAKKKIDNIISTTQEYLDRIHEIDKKEAKKQ